jgi:hypothetical protein
MGLRASREAKAKEVHFKKNSKAADGPTGINKPHPDHVKRVLSGVYDMTILKGYQELEDEYRSKIAVVIGGNVDPDDIPIDMDLMQLSQLHTLEEQRVKLMGMLKNKDHDFSIYCNEIMSRIENIHQTSEKKHHAT